MQPVIRFENVGKLYRLGTVGTGTLSHDLRRWWITSIMRREDPYLKIGETNDRSTKGSSEYVYALRNINLDIYEGDVLGIIGKNGAGKSTLLKLLSRITAPTTGKIYTRGRIATLLEVGTGFHPELTGRENIYMNGSILGMKKWEIDKKLDEIIDFSGCERYIDTPVKRYSSGMMVRLGFAVAAHLDPEILVVDEVLAVGDAEFQKKAIGKMQDISKGEGRTVLFVSHNMGSVRRLCHSGLILKDGQIEYTGSAFDAVDHYISEDSAFKNNTFTTVSDYNRLYPCSKEIEFISFEFIKGSTLFASNEDIELKITFKSKIDVTDCRINCTLFNNEKDAIGTNSSFQTFSIKQGDTKQVHYLIKNPKLTKGLYTCSFSIGTGNTTTGEKNYDIVSYIISFEVDKLDSNNSKFFNVWQNGWGNIFIDTEIREITTL